MQRAATIEDKIASNYSDLSAKLRDAADFVAGNPVEVATRSLRSLSAASGVSPATFSRLARALGFDSYEEMRELSRSAVGQQVMSFSEKAGRLQADTRNQASMIHRQAAACVSNIAALENGIDQTRLCDAVAMLRSARNVVLFGAFGSTGIVEYMAYLANYFTVNWTLAGRMGASLGSALAAIGAGDVLLVVTKTPFARRAIISCETAQRHGASVIVITDSHSCPAIKFATITLIVPSESPQFFSSYAATLVLMETMIAMLVAGSKEDIGTRIREVEDRNRKLGEFWAD